MSVVGDFTVSADVFALGEALGTVPEMTVEADQMASHSPKEVFPFLWATGGDYDQFYNALECDQTVTAASIADRSDEEVLYRLEWSEEFCELIHEIVDHHAAILNASAQDGTWDLRLRFAEEEMVSDFQTHFHEAGYRFEVNELYSPTEPRQQVFGLTSDQHEALVTATEKGYFSIPRGISVEELGDELGISASAVSQRLRRGSKTLVRSSLIITEGEE